MEFSEVIKSRRSIRKFKTDPVPNHYIKELLEAARLAPSGLNLQPWRYVIVKNQAVREEIAKTTHSVFLATAPLLVICCTDTKVFGSTNLRVNELQEVNAFAGTPFAGQTGDDFYNTRNIDEASLKANLIFNTAFSIDHLVLKANDLGLGSCYIGIFDRKKVKEIVGLEDRYEILSMVSIGYPDQEPAERPRLSVGEILLKEI